MGPQNEIIFFKLLTFLASSSKTPDTSLRLLRTKETAQEEEEEEGEEEEEEEEDEEEEEEEEDEEDCEEEEEWAHKTKLFLFTFIFFGIFVSPTVQLFNDMT